MHDLPHSVSVARPYLFADDTKCLHIIKALSDYSAL